MVIADGPDVNQNVVLDTVIMKRLLNRWTRVPCTGDLGTWYVCLSVCEKNANSGLTPVIYR